MADPAGELTVTRNAERGRYEGYLGAELAGFVDVAEDGERLLVMHTETLPAFGDRGVGSQLVSAVMDDVAQRGQRVRSYCGFFTMKARGGEHAALLDG